MLNIVAIVGKVVVIGVVGLAAAVADKYVDGECKKVVQSRTGGNRERDNRNRR